MILIYAYINKFKNYTTQEIIFDHRWHVNFSNNKLLIQYRGQSSASAVIRGDRKPDNLHILVGKTGSGKTNLLQMIGAKHDVRYHRKWEGEDDSYFLLYSISDTEFFLEICDMEIMQFPKPVERDDSTIPEPIRENARRAGTLRTVRFALEKVLKPGETAVRFCAVKEYGYERNLSELKVRDMAMIMNCYDAHAFIRPPYPDDKEDFTDFRSDWIGRAAFPYQRTSLWQICGYIREYLTSLEPGSGKRQVSFVLSTHNFADRYPLKLSKAVEKEYWTFYERMQDEKRAIYDPEARERVRKRKKKKTLTNKQMFIHDLWTDYAKYLRKWVEKIRNFNAEEDPAEDLDAYQEFMDYYIGKTRRESIDPTVLPDGEKMSIVRRCTWLAEYIDRAGDGDPHGLLWQIMGDIKDIAGFLEKLDDRYFTVDTCSIPVVDMERPEYRELFDELFERMEQYRPDDAGIFTECLLPYEFTRLSTGEYQYAKVLGGLEDYLKLSSSGRANRRLDKIILMDEPEAYMHPELARQFIARMLKIVEKYQGPSTIQIILSTHSPFMLSDVLPEEITRLTIDRETGNALVKNGSDKEYFGANIHTILADGFFLDYTIGEYSRSFLQNAFSRLERYADHGDADESFLMSMEQLIPHIGDRMIRRAFELQMEKVRKHD